MGRTTKLTPETSDTIVDAVTNGALLKDAATAAGIHETTLRRWMRYGDPDATRGKGWPKTLDAYRSFRSAVTRARATCKTVAVRKILESDDWRAVAWFLERSFPDDYGRRSEITVITRDAIDEAIRELESELESLDG